MLPMPAIITAETKIVRSDWFIRPKGSGPHGDSSGTSYANAFDMGLEALTWGDGADLPNFGYRLFVCGDHTHDMTDSASLSTQARISPPAGRGYIRNEIRGDWPADPGTIFGGPIASYNSWVLDTDSTYTFDLVGTYYQENFFDARDWSLLTPQASIAAVKANPGSWFEDTTPDPDKLYVRLADSADPTGKVLLSRHGYHFNFDKLDNFNIIGLDFKGFRGPSAAWVPPSNFSFINCLLTRGEIYAFQINGNVSGGGPNRNWEFIGGEISFFGNGIYSTTTSNTDKCFGFSVKDTLIQDIGVRAIDAGDGDMHAIGVQGSENVTLQRLTVRRAGNAIVMYCFGSQDMKNLLVEDCLIEEDNAVNATNKGIEFAQDNDSLGDKSNNVARGNTINDYPTALRCQSEDLTLFEDNICNGSGIAFESARTFEGKGPDVKLRGNQFLNTVTTQIRFSTSADEATFNIDSDENTFTGVDDFTFEGATGQNFTAWKANSSAGCVFDPNSSGP